MKDSFGATSELEAGGTSYRIHRVDALADRFPVDSLPYSLKVLLENVLRLEDGVAVTAADAEAIAGWDPAAEPSDEIPFQPARVLMQDFTGVPAVVDLAAMRDAMAAIGGEPSAINPLVDVDAAGPDRIDRGSLPAIEAALKLQRFPGTEAGNLQ